MRLTETQRQILVSAIWGRDPQAEIYLYGSRANDEARGGDIDLLVIKLTSEVAAFGRALVARHGGINANK